MTLGLFLAAAALLVPLLLIVMGSMIVAGEADDWTMRLHSEMTNGDHD